jgi:hypothetical protein
MLLLQLSFKMVKTGEEAAVAQTGCGIISCEPAVVQQRRITGCGT